MFIPERYQYDNAPIKTILLYNNLNSWKIDVGQSGFISNNCPVNRCAITTDQSKASNVDAIMFRDEFIYPGPKNTDLQVRSNVINDHKTYVYRQSGEKSIAVNDPSKVRTIDVLIVERVTGNVGENIDRYGSAFESRMQTNYFLCNIFFTKRIIITNDHGYTKNIFSNFVCNELMSKDVYS